MKTPIALALVITFATAACAPRYASHSTVPRLAATTVQTEPELLAEFVNGLPTGSRLRVDLKDGSTIKGTLLSATTDRIVVQRKTRIPETARTIPVSAISMVQIDQGGGVGKAVAMGAAAGAGAAAVVLLILILALSD